jgi:hypothetical protein
MLHIIGVITIMSYFCDAETTVSLAYSRLNSFDTCHSLFQALFLSLLFSCLSADMLCLILFWTYLGKSLLSEQLLSEQCPSIVHLASLFTFSLSEIPTCPTVHLIVRLYFTFLGLLWRCFAILNTSATR